MDIYDLVLLLAGSFGKTGDGIMGDVNTDGSVNIFDLVITAGNFGKSLAAAPAMTAKIETGKRVDGKKWWEWIWPAITPRIRVVGTKW